METEPRLSSRQFGLEVLFEAGEALFLGVMLLVVMGDFLFGLVVWDADAALAPDFLGVPFDERVEESTGLETLFLAPFLGLGTKT